MKGGAASFTFLQCFQLFLFAVGGRRVEASILVLSHDILLFASLSCSTDRVDESEIAAGCK